MYGRRTHVRWTMGIVAIVAAMLSMSVAMSAALAAESEFRISPRGGIGELEIDAARAVNDDREELRTFGVGVTLGFLTPIGVVIGAGYESYGSINLFDIQDDFSISQRFVVIGYQFDLGQGWRLIPQVGRSRWRLTSEESPFFNPGPEQTRTLRGYEYFGELSFAKQVTKAMSLGGSVRYGDYDFGSARSAAFEMSFGF
jgi:hypothetical protein